MNDAPLIRRRSRVRSRRVFRKNHPPSACDAELSRQPAISISAPVCSSRSVPHAARMHARRCAVIEADAEESKRQRELQERQDRERRRARASANLKQRWAPP